MKKIAFISLVVLLLAGCKPTENNYRSAYEKAVEAAQRKAEAEMESINGEKMESLDGPRVEVIDGDTILIARNRIKPFETSLEKPCKGGVAVARYSMPTNAKRHADDLRKGYPESFVGFDGEEYYYVIIETVDNSTEAASIIRKFKVTRPEYNYIGLQGTPLLIFF